MKLAVTALVQFAAYYTTAARKRYAVTAFEIYLPDRPTTENADEDFNRIEVSTNCVRRSDEI